MTSKKNYHTSYDRERGQWKVQRAGGKKADSYHGTAESAWERTRDLAEKVKEKPLNTAKTMVKSTNGTRSVMTLSHHADKPT